MFFNYHFQENFNMNKIQKNFDRKFRIDISKDLLSVHCSFIPASGSGRILSCKEIMTALNDLEIDQNVIDKKRIKACVRYANESGKSVINNLIAQGLPPVHQVDEHIEVLFSPENYCHLINKMLNEDSSLKIDYRNFSKLCLLNKDAVVARICSFREGQPGINVKGKMIPFPKPQFTTYKIGRNLEIKGNGDIIAKCFGEYRIRNNTLSIENVLKLNNGVNYETGNIKFDGTVIIQGEVQFDFKIHVSENLFILNSLGAAEVYCGGKIVVVNGGIIGKKSHLVKAEDIIKTVHISNATVEAKNGIFIENDVINSTLRSNDIIHMGRNSRILGSSIFARNGIITHDIGNEFGTRCTLSCGEDILAYEKIKKLEKKKSELAASIEETLRLDPMAETWEISKEIEQYDRVIKRLTDQNKTNVHARVVVKGTVYPGTEIRIVKINYEVTRPLHNGYFYFNCCEGRLMFQRH